MKAQTLSSINTRTLEQEIEDARAQAHRWSRIDARGNAMQAFEWMSPPFPLVITGVVFSEPVFIEQVVFMYELLVAPPERGKRRVAVPAIYLGQRIFTPGQGFRVQLSEPTRATATLEFNDEALVSWTTREWSAPQL